MPRVRRSSLRASSDSFAGLPKDVILSKPKAGARPRAVYTTERHGADGRINDAREERLVDRVACSRRRSGVDRHILRRTRDCRRGGVRTFAFVMPVAPAKLFVPESVSVPGVVAVPPVTLLRELATATAF